MESGNAFCSLPHPSGHLPGTHLCPSCLTRPLPQVAAWPPHPSTGVCAALSLPGPGALAASPPSQAQRSILNVPSPFRLLGELPGSPPTPSSFCSAPGLHLLGLLEPHVHRPATLRPSQLCCPLSLPRPPPPPSRHPYKQASPAPAPRRACPAAPEGAQGRTSPKGAGRAESQRPVGDSSSEEEEGLGEAAVLPVQGEGLGGDVVTGDRGCSGPCWSPPLAKADWKAVDREPGKVNLRGPGQVGMAVGHTAGSGPDAETAWPVSLPPEPRASSRCRGCAEPCVLGPLGITSPVPGTCSSPASMTSLASCLLASGGHRPSEEGGSLSPAPSRQHVDPGGHAFLSRHLCGLFWNFSPRSSGRLDH